VTTEETPPRALTMREWRLLWPVQVLKWIPFALVLVLWCIATPLRALADWAADTINSLYVKAYNADLRRARGPQPRKPGAARPDGYL
jgi:hypothetical protein